MRTDSWLLRQHAHQVVTHFGRFQTTKPDAKIARHAWRQDRRTDASADAEGGLRALRHSRRRPGRHYCNGDGAPQSGLAGGPASEFLHGSAAAPRRSNPFGRGTGLSRTHRRMARNGGCLSRSAGHAPPDPSLWSSGFSRGRPGVDVGKVLGMVGAWRRSVENLLSRQSAHERQPLLAFRPHSLSGPRLLRTTAAPRWARFRFPPVLRGFQPSSPPRRARYWSAFSTWSVTRNCRRVGTSRPWNNRNCGRRMWQRFSRVCDFVSLCLSYLLDFADCHEQRQTASIISFHSP